MAFRVIWSIGISLDSRFGTETGKTRPVLIVQTDV